MAVRFSVALREIASVDRNIFHPYVGRLLLNEDGTLATRGGMLGLRIYDDLERDARVFSVLQKRKAAVNAYPWVIESGGAGGDAAADLVSGMFREMNLEETNVGLMDALLKGFAVGETMWERDGGRIFPDRVITRDQRRFRFDIDYQLHMVTYTDMLVGIDLPDRKFIVHSLGAKDGSPYGLGLGAKLFWPVFFKRQGIGFWMAFLDKYGMPTVKGTYPTTASPQEKQKLQDAADAVAQETSITIPEGMILELLESARTGASVGYDVVAKYMDDQIAEAVLGETLTTSVGDSGSRALGDVHNDVRLELSKGDAKGLVRTYNQSIVRWIVDFNMPGAPYPRMRIEVDEEEDLNARADRDTKIKALGFKPTLDYITNTYGEGWEEAPPPAPIDPHAFGNPNGPGFAEALPAKSGGPLVGSWSDRAGDATAPAIAAMVEQIRALAADCGDIVELRDRLIELYPKLDPRVMGRVMEQALTASNLAGHFEAGQS